ncbi:MAG: hypothetical protein K6G90_09180 [Clostridia bacterium]|nr:hypothetical protein [Clostridia bacterium]
MNDYQLRFLKQSVLGQQVNMNNSEDIIKKCIELADRDMMSGGRFVSNQFKLKTKKERVSYIIKILDDNSYAYTKIDKIKICEDIFWKCDEEKTKTVNGTTRNYKPFGLAQKLVNMTYKYLYVFKDHIGDLKIDFSKCECPLDSVVLQKLGCPSKWTNITPEEYDCIKADINAALEDERYSSMKAEIGALAFDDNWINSDN